MVLRTRVAALEEFWRCYRAGKFFEAHEVLEDAWRAEKSAERERLQGLIHAAVARHHHANGNAEGAARQCVRAHVRLEPFGDEAAFLQELEMAVAPSLGALDIGARERLRLLDERLRREQSEKLTQHD